MMERQRVQACIDYLKELDFSLRLRHYLFALEVAGITVISPSTDRVVPTSSRF